ncbi:hypothetical protein ACRALDRAFT_2036411 [Sodiomyces alcalophilus JCM 7366]|uniref:uncharacterized protein n=1 Tax=Sodiomyces alcalophilus JCM 7366 TaxID=591952 RepID=UPI0039B4DB8D
MLVFLSELLSVFLRLVARQPSRKHVEALRPWRLAPRGPTDSRAGERQRLKEGEDMARSGAAGVCQDPGRLCGYGNADGDG